MEILCTCLKETGTVQRRNQKVVERAPALYLDDAQRQSLCESALRLARQVGYSNAGTLGISDGCRQ